VSVTITDAGGAAATATSQANVLNDVFYVSPTGSDANPGTSAAPWATLQHAVGSILPGDTIEVESGTYAGFTVGSSGTAAALSTLEAAAGATVVVDAPGTQNQFGSDIEIDHSGQTVSYWVINGLEVTGAAAGSGIDLRGTSHITVENCYCHDNHGSGIYLVSSDHPTITHNHVAYSAAQDGIDDVGSSDGATITFNESDHNQLAGIEFDGNSSNGGKGYMSGNLIAENVVHDNAKGGKGAFVFDGLVDSTVENNLLYGNYNEDLVLYRHDASVGSHDNIVVNNTIDMSSRATVGIDLYDKSYNDVLLNNIIVQGQSSQVSLKIGMASLKGFQSDYNIFSTDAVFSAAGGKNRESLAQWQAQTGQDQHSFAAAADQLFANYAGNDYHLAAGSQAIGKGTSTDAPSIDLDGRSRPAGTVDIGCYEHA
jgi:parallel beta-helix repeat protein